MIEEKNNELEEDIKTTEMVFAEMESKDQKVTFLYLKKSMYN